MARRLSAVERIADAVQDKHLRANERLRNENTRLAKENVTLRRERDDARRSLEIANERWQQATDDRDACLKLLHERGAEA